VTFAPGGRVTWGLGPAYEAPVLQLNGVDEFGIEWVVENVDGWRTTNASLPIEEGAGDGGWFGIGRRPSKTLTMTGGFRPVRCGADMDDAEDRFRDAVEVLDRDVLLWREDGTQPKQMAVRQAGPCIVDPHRGTRARTFSVVLGAADPYKYAAGLAGIRTITRRLVAPVFGGLTFPARSPWNFGGAAGLEPDYNPGRAPSRDTVFTLTGPTPPNPRLLNRTTGQTFALRFPLADGQKVVVDCAAETVTVDGVSQLSARAYGAEFWAVQPGDNDVRFLADSYNGVGLATVTYRPAWR
jgi:hypothetical protein